MIDISKKTDPIPGSAVNNPSTTRRSDGTAETTRKTRKMRNARKTESPCAPGTSAMPTITKSKMFQPERKNLGPKATSLSKSSTTKMAKQA